MNRKRLVPILAMAVAVAGFFVPCANAKEDGPRYKMSPVDNGFVRLDTDTGAMSFCTRNGEDWSCKPMGESGAGAGGGAGSSEELARLRQENSNLQDEIRRMEETFGLDARGSRAGSGESGDNGIPDDKTGDVPEIRLPDEEQVDQAVDYLERMIRKFRERFEQFGERTEPRSGGQNHGRQQERDGERERDGQDDDNSSEPRRL